METAGCLTGTSLCAQPGAAKTNQKKRDNCLVAPVISDPRPENTERKFPMKKNSASQSAFFNLRVLIAALFCLAGIAVALFGTGAFSSAFAQGKGTRNNNSTKTQ